MKHRARIFISGFGPAGSSLLLAASLLLPAHSFATAVAGQETANPKVEIFADSISIEHLAGAPGAVANSGSTSVPEPTAAALAFSSLALLASRRRR